MIVSMLRYPFLPLLFIYLLKCTSSDDLLFDEPCANSIKANLNCTNELENKTDFVVVGSQGTLLYSKNAIDWYKRKLPWDKRFLPSHRDGIETRFLENRNLFSLAYGNGLLVATGDWGYIFVSSDKGKTWQRADRKNLKLVEGENCPSGLNNCFAVFKDIAYADGWFIGIGAKTTIGRTRNPLLGPWEFYDREKITFFDSRDGQFLSGIIYGGGYWLITIAPLIDETKKGLLYSRDNGESWEFFNPFNKTSLPYCRSNDCRYLDYYNTAIFSEGRFFTFTRDRLFPSEIDIKDIDGSPLRTPQNRGVFGVLRSKTSDPGGEWELGTYSSFGKFASYRDQLVQYIATDNKGTYVATNRDAFPIIKLPGDGWRSCRLNECDEGVVQDNNIDSFLSNRDLALGNPSGLAYYNGLWFRLHHKGYFSSSEDGKYWNTKRIALHYQLNDIIGIR